MIGAIILSITIMSILTWGLLDRLITSARKEDWHDFKYVLGTTIGVSVFSVVIAIGMFLMMLGI